MKKEEDAPETGKLLDGFIKALEVYVPIGLSIASAVAQTIDQQLHAFVEKTFPKLEALARIDWPVAMQRLHDMAGNSKVAMSLAASQGWFFGWNDSLQGVMELTEKLKLIPVAEVDEVMVGYYRTNLAAFTKELVSRYPNRAPVIQAAVNAHTTLGDEGYFLSIPIFIAQADGLLAELTNVTSPFGKDPKGLEARASRVLNEKLAGNQESLDLILPLLNLYDLDFLKSSIRRNESKKNASTGVIALNRHQVMHGESWDYGTEINSLKAFSFLVHVGAHLPLILERDQRDDQVLHPQ